MASLYLAEKNGQVSQTLVNECHELPVVTASGDNLDRCQELHKTLVLQGLGRGYANL